MCPTLPRAAEEGAEPLIDELLDAMAVMMDQSQFASEQLVRATQRHQEPGFAQRFTEWWARCAALDAQFRVHIGHRAEP
jgi:hypothetical protein